MTRSVPPTVLLDLPAVAARSALRAGLMALRVHCVQLPADRTKRNAILSGLGKHPESVAFIDISVDGSAATSLLELEVAMARGEVRQRIVLTRLTAGHVCNADRRWAQSLGFADLLPEFDPMDCEGGLRTALDAVAHRFALTPLEPAELMRYVRVLNGDRAAAGSPRTTVRALTGNTAEDFAALLSRSLDVRDRNYHLQRYAHCFVGTEAVDWIAAHLGCSRTEAVAIGQALAALGLLVHVVHEHPFLDDRLFYRLALSKAADEVFLGEARETLRGRKGQPGVPIADRSYLGKSYPQCFVGSEAIDVLCQRHGLARHDAWIVLHRLAQFGLLTHVTLSRPIIDGAFFYRFSGLAPQGEAA